MYVRTYVHSFVRTGVQPGYMARPYIPPYIRPHKPTSVHTKKTLFQIFGLWAFWIFRLYWTLLPPTAPYWTLLDPTGPYWTLLDPTGPYCNEYEYERSSRRRYLTFVARTDGRSWFGRTSHLIDAAFFLAASIK